LSGTGDIHTARILGTRQIERLTEFAAIDFGFGSPGFFHVPAFLFENVGSVEPALKMSAAEFSFFVFLVAGTLAGLLELKLCGSGAAGSYL